MPQVNIQKHIVEMVDFAIDFAYNKYVVPNVKEGGTLHFMADYFEGKGNLYNTPSTRQAVAEILRKVFAETTATPYENKSDAGQIILAGALGSKKRLEEALLKGELGEELQNKFVEARKHSVPSDFDLFKKELSLRDVNDYDYAKHDLPSFSKIRGLCSGLDNAIQQYSHLFGLGVIVDNTLAPVAQQQKTDFEEGFPKTCERIKVTVIGLALTADEAEEQYPANPSAAAESARAFAQYDGFTRRHASDVALFDGNLQPIYSHKGRDTVNSKVDVEAMTVWRKSCGVRMPEQKAWTPPSFEDEDNDHPSKPTHIRY